MEIPSAGTKASTLVGFHCCARGEDEHPLKAYVAAAKGMGGDAAMQRRLDGFLASHGVSIDAEPTPDASRRMQRCSISTGRTGSRSPTSSREFTLVGACHSSQDIPGQRQAA
jgi:hypothetical protein